MKQESNRRESWSTQRNQRESELLAGTDFSENSRLYVVLKLPKDPHAILSFSLVMAYTYALFVFHWSRLTSTHCLIFLCRGLHPHNAMAMVYTHSMILFTKPSARAGYDTRSIFLKRNLTDLNSEFSFS